MYAIRSYYVTRVDVTDAQSEVVFSFYYTTEVNKVSEGGDGSTAIHAFMEYSTTDPFAGTQRIFQCQGGCSFFV